jgi:hypothetical protein
MTDFQSATAWSFSPRGLRLQNSKIVTRVRPSVYPFECNFLENGIVGIGPALRNSA